MSDGRTLAFVGLMLAGGADLTGCARDAAPRDPEVDRIYRIGLDRVMGEAHNARERQDLRRGYDIGFSAGSEEAVAVNARTRTEMGRLGCRMIHPTVAELATRAQRDPPTVAAFCPPATPAGELGSAEARHRGSRFDDGRNQALAIARSAPDRRLGHMVREAFEYGYERGYRARLAAWDEDAAHDIEVSGCESAVQSAIRAEHVTVFDREALMARCAALPVHSLGVR